MSSLPRLLPVSRPYAIWDDASGLIVSPLGRSLPTDIVHDSASRDWRHPRRLEDDKIYQGFFPRSGVYEGHLFGRVGVNDSRLLENIVEESGGWILQKSIRDSWARLENFIVKISKKLLDGFVPEPAAAPFTLPNITPPFGPVTHRYRRHAPTKQAAFQRSKGARDAFQMLSAYATFAFSIWLGIDEETCFDAAIQHLASLHIEGITYETLDYVRHSIICDLSPGLRPGFFLSSYHTCWGPAFRNFTRASVPIWLVWGKPDRWDTPTADRGLREYLFPPQKEIDGAQARGAAWQTLILPKPPTYPLPRFADADAEFVTHPSLTDRPPTRPLQIDRTEVVDRTTGQLPKENWDGFFARMESSLQSVCETESPLDHANRLRRQEIADEEGYIAGARVYIWDRDDQVETFWRRRLLGKAARETEWKQFHHSQRRFWSHTNEWDLCHPLQPSSGNPYADISALQNDDEYGNNGDNGTYDDNDDNDLPYFENHKSSSLELALNRVRPSSIGQVIPPIETYLLDRHGYDITVEGPWEYQLHGIPYLPYCDRSKSFHYLGYEPPVPPSYSPDLANPIGNFCNVTSTAESSTGENKTQYSDLDDKRWDISSRCNFMKAGLRVVKAQSSIVDSPLWIILPDQSLDNVPWVIATHSATAVLFAFRSPVISLLDIGQLFLDYGISFYTAAPKRRKEKIQAKGWRGRPGFIGRRPRKTQPSPGDYLEYLDARSAVLESRVGRAVRLRGGIAGRIARDIVPDLEVLNGPLIGNLHVGSISNFDFVDDDVTEAQLDVVCGVFHTLNSHDSSSASAAHESFWPKQSVWFGCGLAGDQWLPRAEDFFQNRTQNFGRGQLGFYNSKDWKSKLKFDLVRSKNILAGSEALASAFLIKSKRSPLVRF